MWDVIQQVISIGAVVGVILTILTKTLPNDKVYMVGWNGGSFLTRFGRGRLGRVWEDIENFFTESLGHLFNGFKDGLNSDDGNGGLPPNPPEVDRLKDVRT